MRARLIALLAASAAILAAVLVVAFGHDALASFGLRAVGGMLGYEVGAQRTHVTGSSLALADVVIRNHSGEPVLTADHVDIAFSLRDLLPGSKHRFGLRAVDIARPQLTLIHHADGTYNVALPGAGGPPPRPDTTPLDVHVRVRDGSIALIDRFIVPNHERRESITGLAVDAILAPTDPSYYRVDATLHDGARTYPILGRARFDHRRAFASQHWHADELPIGALVNFALATHAIHIVDGRLRNVDARIYGFMHPDGTTDTHIGGVAELIDGKIFAAQLRVPIGDAHGIMNVYDDGISTTGIDATLAGVPLHLMGGIYGLTSPQMRFAMDGRGPLSKLRTVSDQSVHRPLGGDVAFAMRVDGPIDKPFVRGSFSSPQITYERYVLTGAAGSIAFSGTDFQLAGAQARYGPLALRAHGVLTLAKHVDTDLVTEVDGPGDALPYGAALLPGATVHAVVHLVGTDERLAARGAVDAAGPHGTLDTTFGLQPDGTGTVGPLELARDDGATVYTRLAYDRPDGLVDGIVSAQHLSLLRAARTRLPGLPAAALPDVSGTLDADLVGEVRGAQVVAASGQAHARSVGIAGLGIGDADATLGANPDGISISDLSVRGPLGELRGSGAYAEPNSLLALRAHLRSSFDRLTPFLRGVHGRGGIDADLNVVADRTNRVVQIADARFRDARLAGIPLQSATATVAMRGNAIDVGSARLNAAGGSVVASGSFGNGGNLRLSASGIDAGALRGAGLPIGAGRIAGIAVVGGTQRDPHASAGLALSGARFDGAPVAAVAAGSYAGGNLDLERADLTYGTAVADAHGTVYNVLGRPNVDVVAQVRGADVGTFAHRMGIALPYPDAALDADVHVRGAASDPAIAGNARIAAGSINGLAFHDLVVPLGGDLASVIVHGGHATVGSTTLQFDAVASRGAASGSLRADRADLSDFNDYFDTADTLAGRGHLALAFAMGSGALSSSGDVALTGTRIRRLPIGDVAAHWSSQGPSIVGDARVGGSHGLLVAHGAAQVPGANPLAHLAQSALDAHATIAGLDLGTWLPAVGINAPVTGRLDGDVRVRGVAPRLAVAGNASLHDGIIGRMPIDRLAIAASGDQRRVRITSAQMEAPDIVANGTGSFGMGANDPIQLALHATSPDIAALAYHATGMKLNAAGALDTTVSVAGTRRAPIVHDVLDLDRPRYQALDAKHAHVDLAYAAHRLTLRDAALDLVAGRLDLSGSVPATLTPPFIDRRNAPIAARVIAQGVDVGQFDPAFPKGTKVGGLINGDVAIAGTMSNPALNGNLQLSKGSYVSPQLASELHNAALQLAFAGRDVRMTKMHADMGGGALDGAGTAHVGDLRNGFDALAFDVRTNAKNLGIEIPKLLRAKIDGSVALTRDAGRSVLVDGDLAIAHARLNPAGLLFAKSASPSKAPLPIAFALNIAATNDDRLQGPFVDVGAKGALAIGGTLAQPAISGAMNSTDGTISFYRTFTLEHAHIAFDPSNGIIPYVNATATTHVPDPSTDVVLHAHGQATALTLDFASDPGYDKSQIVGLLIGAQNLGAVAGVAATSPGSFSGGNVLQGAALGFVDQQFTQQLFEPFSASIGRALGLDAFNINTGLTGGFTASALRRLGEHVTASFSESSDAESGRRESFALDYRFSNASNLQLTLFDAGNQGRTIGTSTPFAKDQPTNYQLQSLAPTPGTSGYVFSYVHRFP